MGFRFRKSLKIAPGVRWNVGLRGSSISVGRRGASVSFGKRGVRATVGLPGTGLSYTESLSASRRGPRNPVTVSAGPSPDALSISAITPRRIVAVASAVFLWLWPLAGVGGLLVALLLPSRSALARKELDRRMTMLQAAASTLKEDSSVEDVDYVLTLAKQIPGEQPAAKRLTDNLVAMRTLIPLEREGTLTEVDAARGMLGAERCYLMADVYLDKHGPDEEGQVYFGETQILFIGSSRIEIPWDKVRSCDQEGGVVTILRADRKTPFKFHFADVETGAQAAWIATKLRQQERA